MPVTQDTARARVTAVLRTSQCALPVEEISRMAQVPPQQVKNTLSRNAEFVNVGSKRRGMYRYLEPAKIEPPPPPEKQWQTTSVYRGEPGLPMRPGADEFLRCGSVENGKVVERKRPAIISAANNRRMVA